MKFYNSIRPFTLRADILSVSLGVVFAVFSMTALIVAGESFFGVLTKGLLTGFVKGFVFGLLIGWVYTIFAKRVVRRAKVELFEINDRFTVIQEGDGEAPYTIAFVANPAILTTEGSPVTDPIIHNKQLFFKVIVRCLKSFVSEELFQLSEVFSKFRIVAIFDDEAQKQDPPTDDVSLCQEIGSHEVTNILAPRLDVETINNYVKSYTEPADIIFLISASKELTRSTSRFTVDDPEALAKGEGIPFEFTFGNSADVFSRRIHPFYASQPGVAALSAWDDRLKTPIHEFAHAMSSVENGMIVDEYEDAGFDENLQNYSVNKKFRNAPDGATPKIFAKYKLDGGAEVIYSSDRKRTDKPPGWKSYAPEIDPTNDSCIMDIAYFGYRFDRLIFDFMYDRLLVKLNRPKKV